MAEHKTLNLVELVPGERVRLAGGALAEVVENPKDGTWVICRYIGHPTMPALVEAGEQPVFAADIEAVVK